jgi:hypothetical protein
VVKEEKSIGEVKGNRCELVRKCPRKMIRGDKNERVTFPSLIGTIFCIESS